MKVSMTFARRLVLVGLTLPLLLAVFASPALAATKLLDVRDRDINFTAGPFPATICGISDLFTFPVRIVQFTLVVWDNGHLIVQETTQVEAVSGGDVMARGTVTSQHTHGQADLPQTFQDNFVATCTPASGARGTDVNMHFGLTIGEDGFPKQVHVIVK